MNPFDSIKKGLWEDRWFLAMTCSVTILASCLGLGGLSASTAVCFILFSWIVGFTTGSMNEIDAQIKDLDDEQLRP